MLFGMFDLAEISYVETEGAARTWDQGVHGTGRGYREHVIECQLRTMSTPKRIL